MPDSIQEKAANLLFSSATILQNIYLQTNGSSLFQHFQQEDYDTVLENDYKRVQYFRNSRYGAISD
jgi:hypothetical protein